MKQTSASAARRVLTGLSVAPLALLFFAGGALSPALAAEPAVGLGLVGSYAVLGGETVTNDGPSVVTGNVGVSPG